MVFGSDTGSNEKIAVQVFNVFHFFGCSEVYHSQSGGGESTIHLRRIC